MSTDQSVKKQRQIWTGLRTKKKQSTLLSSLNTDLASISVSMLNAYNPGSPTLVKNEDEQKDERKDHPTNQPTNPPFTEQTGSDTSLRTGINPGIPEESIRSANDESDDIVGDAAAESEREITVEAQRQRDSRHAIQIWPGLYLYPFKQQRRKYEMVGLRVITVQNRLMPGRNTIDEVLRQFVNHWGAGIIVEHRRREITWDFDSIIDRPWTRVRRQYTAEQKQIVLDRVKKVRERLDDMRDDDAYDEAIEAFKRQRRSDSFISDVYQRYKHQLATAKRPQSSPTEGTRPAESNSAKVIDPTLIEDIKRVKTEDNTDDDRNESHSRQMPKSNLERRISELNATLTLLKQQNSELRDSNWNLNQNIRAREWRNQKQRADHYYNELRNLRRKHDRLRNEHSETCDVYKIAKRTKRKQNKQVYSSRHQRRGKSGVQKHISDAPNSQAIRCAIAESVLMLCDDHPSFKSKCIDECTVHFNRVIREENTRPEYVKPFLVALAVSGVSIRTAELLGCVSAWHCSVRAQTLDEETDPKGDQGPSPIPARRKRIRKTVGETDLITSRLPTKRALAATKQWFFVNRQWLEYEQFGSRPTLIRRNIRSFLGGYLSMLLNSEYTALHLADLKHRTEDGVLQCFLLIAVDDCPVHHSTVTSATLCNVRALLFDDSVHGSPLLSLPVFRSLKKDNQVNEEVKRVVSEIEKHDCVIPVSHNAGIHTVRLIPILSYDGKASTVGTGSIGPSGKHYITEVIAVAIDEHGSPILESIETPTQQNFIQWVESYPWFEPNKDFTWDESTNRASSEARNRTIRTWMTSSIAVALWDSVFERATQMIVENDESAELESIQLHPRWYKACKQAADQAGHGIVREPIPIAYSAWRMIRGVRRQVFSIAADTLHCSLRIWDAKVSQLFECIRDCKLDCDESELIQQMEDDTVILCEIILKTRSMGLWNQKARDSRCRIKCSIPGNKVKLGLAELGRWMLRVVNHLVEDRDRIELLSNHLSTELSFRTLSWVSQGHFSAIQINDVDFAKVISRTVDAAWLQSSLQKRGLIPSNLTLWIIAQRLQTKVMQEMSLAPDSPRLYSLKECSLQWNESMIKIFKSSMTHSFSSHKTGDGGHQSLKFVDLGIVGGIEEGMIDLRKAERNHGKPWWSSECEKWFGIEGLNDRNKELYSKLMPKKTKDGGRLIDAAIKEILHKESGMREVCKLADPAAMAQRRREIDQSLLEDSEDKYSDDSLTDLNLFDENAVMAALQPIKANLPALEDPYLSGVQSASVVAPEVRSHLSSQCRPSKRAHSSKKRSSVRLGCAAPMKTKQRKKNKQSIVQSMFTSKRRGDPDCSDVD